MPRLGAGSDHGDASPRRRTVAYAASRNNFNISNVILLLAFTFILRNIFFTDYRTEEINTLKASGKSAEEISKLVPQNPSERRQTTEERKTEYERLKVDVKVLKEEMETLKAQIKAQEEGDDATDDDNANESGEEDGNENESDPLEQKKLAAATKSRPRGVEENYRKALLTDNLEEKPRKRTSLHAAEKDTKKLRTANLKTTGTTIKTVPRIRATSVK